MVYMSVSLTICVRRSRCTNGKLVQEAMPEDEETEEDEEKEAPRPRKRRRGGQ